MYNNPYDLLVFMQESNAIEGEFETQGIGRINPGDIEAAQWFLDQKEITLPVLLTLHQKLGQYLVDSKAHLPGYHDWVGRLRKCNVRVGSYIAPPHEQVKKMMTAYIKKFKTLDSWEAHNEYEKIHPFEDLNGRVGRLIWLWKAANEKQRYTFKIPFLQAYYYQTLTHFENDN